MRFSDMPEVALNAHKPLTTDELAAHLRVSRRTIFNWIECGKIPVMRLSSRCLRYDIDKVMEALSENAS